MQNSIRHGDYEIAGYCLWELLPQYESYLRKRLLVISAEDCYGIITKEILNLCRTPGDEALEKAVSLLCLTKKSRDGDYFVCNLMFNDGTVEGDKLVLQQKLFKAIRGMDLAEAGKLTAHLFKKNRAGLWVMLKTMAELYYPHLQAEVNALCEANNEVTKPAEETIFVAKAICLFWTKREDERGFLGYDGMSCYDLMDVEAAPIIKHADDCRKIDGDFPEWCYNWHTTKGKYKMKRDAVHAISNDQKILTPLEVNLFDDCSWDVDINACLEKWNPRNRLLPYTDGLRDPFEKYGKKE